MTLPASSGAFDELRRALRAAPCDASRYRDDPFVILALDQALQAAEEGNFGIGAVLVDDDGAVVVRARNHVFVPNFRSDRHAEMEAMSQLEEGSPTANMVQTLSLFTSLEPCPMCLTRLITAGVPRVYYAAPDVAGGMVERLSALPPIWQELARTQQFGAARCSPDLQNLSLRILQTTADACNQKLLARRGGGGDPSRTSRMERG